MNQRKPTDKGTDDLPGATDVSAGTGQPSEGAAHGASGKPAADQRAAGTSGGVAGATEPPSAARVSQDTSVQAGGIADAAATVSSGKVPTGTAPQAGSAPDAAETVSPADTSTGAAPQAGGAAGAAETVSSGRVPTGTAPQAGSAPDAAETGATAQAGAAPDTGEKVSSAPTSTGAAPQAGGAAGAAETFSSERIPAAGTSSTPGGSQSPTTADTVAQAHSAAGNEGTETVSSAQSEKKAGDAARAAGDAEPESTGRHAAETGSEQETPIAESVRRATERAEQVEAEAATAAERGAAGIPGPVAHTGRTLLETLRDKPVLAAIPASVLAFIFWRAFRRG
ncbi:hypothetical protein [Nocardia beijingensis]|uniref:Uncharacterized protein n=1 Tax=Nocardia beijingensis TaxID=95162 RepID=A0ABW7WGJ2_9NOCA